MFISFALSMVTDEPVNNNPIVDDRLKNIEPKMIELIQSEIMNNTSNISKYFRFLLSR